jgi:hypothetical protein
LVRIAIRIRNPSVGYDRLAGWFLAIIEWSRQYIQGIDRRFDGRLGRDGRSHVNFDRNQ